MNTQIDLSKVYSGQVISLANKERYEIKKVSKRDDENSTRYIIYTTDGYAFTYFSNGVHNTKSYLDIIGIEHSLIYKIARLEGKILGMTNATPYISDSLSVSNLRRSIEKLKKELEVMQSELDFKLKALHDESN